MEVYSWWTPHRTVHPTVPRNYPPSFSNGGLQGLGNPTCWDRHAHVICSTETVYWNSLLVLPLSGYLWISNHSSIRCLGKLQPLADSSVSSTASQQIARQSWAFRNAFLSHRRGQTCDAPFNFFRLAMDKPNLLLRLRFVLCTFWVKTNQYMSETKPAWTWMSMRQWDNQMKCTDPCLGRRFQTWRPKEHCISIHLNPSCARKAHPSAPFIATRTAGECCKIHTLGTVICHLSLLCHC